MEFLLHLILFTFSSFYVLIINSLAFSSRSLLQALVVLTLPLIIILYKFSRQSWREFGTRAGKLFFILWGTIIVQLLVLATGGFQSPFLVLIHLFMLGLSFTFTFSISLLFLLFSLIVIFVDLSSTQVLWTLIYNDPELILLQLVSLIVIVPLAYLTSKQYHMKDTLAKILQIKMRTTEKIFESIPEIILITDEQFRIISTNDAATRTLQSSRSELIGKPLFDVLFIKDKDSRLVSAKNLFPQGSKALPSLNPDDRFTLVTSPVSERNVKLQIHAVNQAGEMLSQISFIISFVNASENIFSITLDQARARYEALIQSIKIQLQTEGLKKEMFLLEKIENDTYMVETLKTNKQTTISRIDLAKLCKQIVLLNQDFAKSLHVQTQATLPNFGKEDIAPLTVKNYPVEPEQLTGPFFTIECDPQKIELLIKKLFDIGILLASSEVTPQVVLSTKRVQDALLITLSATSPTITSQDQLDILKPYYSSQLQKTNLSLGSGLEGYLIKRITEMLNLPLTISYEKENSQIIFSVQLPKRQA